MDSDIVTRDCSGRRAVVGLELLQETQEQIFGSWLGGELMLHSKASRQFGSVGLGDRGDVAGGPCVRVTGLGTLRGTALSQVLHRSQHGSRADPGCSWPVWQPAQQAHLCCCASPAVVQGFIFHFPTYKCLSDCLGERTSAHLLNQPQACFMTLTAWFSRSSDIKIYCDTV